MLTWRFLRSPVPGDFGRGFPHGGKEVRCIPVRDAASSPPPPTPHPRPGTHCTQAPQLYFGASQWWGWKWLDALGPQLISNQAGIEPAVLGNQSTSLLAPEMDHVHPGMGAGAPFNFFQKKKKHLSFEMRSKEKCHSVMKGKLQNKSKSRLQAEDIHGSPWWPPLIGAVFSPHSRAFQLRWAHLPSLPWGPAFSQPPFLTSLSCL